MNNNSSIRNVVDHQSSSKIWKIALIVIIVLSFLGVVLIRIILPDSLMYHQGAYLNCAYQIGDSAIVEIDNANDDTTNMTPEKYIEQTDLVAFIEVLDIQPVGHGEGWIYKVSIINEIINQDDTSSIPDIIYLYQPSPTSFNKTFDSKKMTIYCQWPELMLWKDHKYIVFANHVNAVASGTVFNMNNTFQLNMYDYALRSHVIPVAGNFEGTNEMLILEKNDNITEIKPLIQKVEPTIVEGSGGAITYNLTQLYNYDELSKFNYFCTTPETLDLYKKWCNDVLNELKNKLS